MRHPAEFYIKALMVQSDTISDDDINAILMSNGMFKPLAEEQRLYLMQLRQSLPEEPADFDPLNKGHVASVRYLRSQGIYEFFHQTPAMQEAWSLVGTPEKRIVIEQLILSRLELKPALRKVNESQQWLVTEDAVNMYRHFFWNPSLLTFDEWGRFLYGRTSLYERHMTLLLAERELSMHLLRMTQAIESKDMIKDAQKIAYFTLKELENQPGAGPLKVKGVAMLTKTVIECHVAMSTSDMALKEVMREFEKFRMAHPDKFPMSIGDLAPTGNFSKSGRVNESPVRLAPPPEGA